MAGCPLKIKGLGREWEWPDNDVKCRAVVFEWAADLKQVYPHCRGLRTTIQAGGNMGVWPWLLAQRFARVITFEPEPDCLRCLRANLAGTGIEIHGAALGEAPSRGDMIYVPANMGAQFVQPGDAFPIVTIDSLGVQDCDLIYLDIEGFEMKALRGADATIRASKPVIVVEDKNLLGTKKGDIEKWLAADYGYRVVARPHRDVVMACV
jgi:FkbM family methyltransferase